MCACRRGNSLRSANANWRRAVEVHHSGPADFQLAVWGHRRQFVLVVARDPEALDIRMRPIDRAGNGLLG